MSGKNDTEKINFKTKKQGKKQKILFRYPRPANRNSTNNKKRRKTINQHSKPRNIFKIRTKSNYKKMGLQRKKNKPIGTPKKNPYAQRRDKTKGFIL